MLIGIDASRTLRAQRTGTENYSLQVIRSLLGLGSAHRFRLYCHQAPPPGLFSPPDRAALPAPHAPAAELRAMPWPRLWTHLRLAAEFRHRASCGCHLP